MAQLVQCVTFPLQGERASEQDRRCVRNGVYSVAVREEAVHGLFHAVLFWATISG